MTKSLDHYLHLPSEFLKGFRKIWSMVCEVKKVSRHLKECIRYCAKRYWYHISKIHILPDTKKTIIFSYLPNFSFHRWCQKFGKVLQFIMICSVWWSSKRKSSQLFLKIRSILCGRNKYMKKYQTQKLPPFIPQIPDGIKGETFWIK